MVYDLIKWIKFSPKRLALFENLRTEVSIQSGETLQPSLRTFCPTRCTLLNLIQRLLEQFIIWHDALKRLSSHCTDEYATKASGLRLQILDLLICSLGLSFKTVFVKFTSQKHNCSGSNLWSRISRTNARKKSLDYSTLRPTSSSIH